MTLITEYRTVTSLTDQVSPTAQVGIISSGGIACHGMIAVYPGSITVLPEQVNTSSPIVKVNVVRR